MEAFKERMIAEYVELDEKTNKLYEFILKNPKFSELDAFKRDMMRKQLEGMNNYREVLRERMKMEGITHDDLVNYKHPYQNLSFGEALQALEAGKCIRRESWVGDKFVTKQIDSDINAEIVLKMQSLPDSAKELIKQNSSGGYSLPESVPDDSSGYRNFSGYKLRAGLE